MDYIIRTLQSHHLGHCECTEHFLDQENCKEISLENYECTPSAQASIWVSTLSMSLQCICSVPAQYTTLCPQCQDTLERLGVMEEMFRTQVAMTSVALGRTNLVLARAIEDLEGVPTSESEEGRTE